METKEFKRNLRENIKKPKYENVEIKQPPIEDNIERFDWLSGGIQCFVTVLNFSVVSFVLLKDINTTLLCAAVSAIGTFFSSITAYFVKRRRVNKSNSINKEMYCAYLDKIQQKVENEVNVLRDFYNLNYPDVETCLIIVENCYKQLWDRQLLNDDFLLLNLGKTRSRELEIIVPEYDENAIYGEKIRCIKDKEYLEIPRLVDIKNSIIGIIGEDKYINYVINNLLIDMYTHHSYNDVKVILLDLNNNYCDNPFNLKYTYNYSEKIDLIGKDKKEIETIIIWIKKLLENRHNSLLMNNESAFPFPYYVLFVSKNILNKEDEILFCRYTKENIAFSAIFLYQYVELLPEPTDIMIECKEDKILIHNNIDNPLSCTYLKIQKNFIDTFMNKINQIHSIEDNGTYQLLPQISIYDGYHINHIEDLNIIDYWNANENLVTLKIPIGIDEDGKDVILDVSENVDGPHGIIAGTTGSGKSELIQTIVLSMVINYSPKKINFVLIDFKGGLLANNLRDLPHVKKVITSLDEKIEIELEYLREELIRRQQILSEYGENNIIGFNKKYPRERIPSLMIIIDEFAEMKASFPEYMKDIMSIARIGRTLGVHLLLSTQKPSGVVDAQIYANSRYKFCLRVNDKFESQDFLNISDASKIQYPGRGFLKIGASSARLLQIFWSSGYDHDGIVSNTQSNIIIRLIKKIQEQCNN